MTLSKYLSQTWYDPRAEIRSYLIQGNVMFASQPIHEGEIVVIIGGTVMTEEEFRAFIPTVSSFNAVQIGEDSHLVDISTAPGGMNHSCDANLWMRDEVKVISRREIAAGDELTPEYALYTTSSAWTMKPCCCGTLVCRQAVTGADWQRADVQERYRDHFSPFINERIRHLSQL